MTGRLLDERGRPPWLRPAPPSLRLLAGPDAYCWPVVIRYAPQVAARFAAAPARHHESWADETLTGVDGAAAVVHRDR